MVCSERITIRTMTVQDIEAVSDIEASVEDGWTADGIASALDASHSECFVAVRNMQVAGFACFTVVAPEANLNALSVHGDARRCGIAHTLLTNAFAQLQAQGVTQVFLEVRTQNTPARTLYDLLGFTALCVRRNFYTNPTDDAVVMEKELC